jgi:hypothetical protein
MQCLSGCLLNGRNIGCGRQGIGQSNLCAGCSACTGLSYRCDELRLYACARHSLHIKTMLSAYAKAGGKAPAILFIVKKLALI